MMLLCRGERASPRSLMMIRLIPEQFIGLGRRPVADDYARLLKLTDFVAGMTDCLCGLPLQKGHRHLCCLEAECW